MPWCFSTRASVAKVLIMHPWVSMFYGPMEKDFVVATWQGLKIRIFKPANDHSIVIQRFMLDTTSFVLPCDFSISVDQFDDQSRLSLPWHCMLLTWTAQDYSIRCQVGGSTSPCVSQPVSQPVSSMQATTHRPVSPSWLELLARRLVRHDRRRNVITQYGLVTSVYVKYHGWQPGSVSLDFASS